jgi:hypothetical protein
MKSIRILIGLAVLAALFGASVHSVQAVGVYTYITGFQVQNIDGVNDASVTINFYNPDGTKPAPGGVSSDIIDTILKGSSKTYLTFNVGTGFQGSVVVSSSTRVASVVNIIGTGPGNAAASYVGAMSGSTSLYVPLLMKGNNSNNTWMSVQNTGGAATDVTVTYSDTTTPSTKTALAPGAAYIFDQSAETSHTLKVFSAVVTASGGIPLAATVVQETTSVMYAYGAFASTGSTTVVFPLVNSNNSGIATGIQIQNNGNSDTNVTLSYTHSIAGTDCTEMQPITAHKSATFALFAFGGNTIPNGGNTTCVGGARFVGSALVTTNSASMPLVGVVNQLNGGKGYAEAYNAFDPSTAAATVVLPLIQDRNGTHHTAYTGFSLMNVGAAANVSCTFSGTGVTYTVPSMPLAQYQSLIDIQGSKIQDRYVGSATCTATTGGLLVAVVNEYADSTGDNFMVYEGIPVTP